MMIFEVSDGFCTDSLWQQGKIATFNNNNKNQKKIVKFVKNQNQWIFNQEN